MSVKFGFEAKLYRDNAGTWTEIANVKDLTLNISTSEVDVTTRANAGWKATIGALKDAALEFGMVYDAADAAQTALRNAFINRTPIPILAMDGDYDAEAGASQGLQFTAAVLKFELPQNLDEAQVVNISIKPTYTAAASAPAWKSSPVADLGS